MPRLALALLGGAVLLVDGQQATFHSAVNLVPIHATVTSPEGKFATGLSRDDFTLTDNGARQPIVSFSNEVQPLSVSIVLDTSASMNTARARVTDAAGAPGICWPE